VSDSWWLGAAWASGFPYPSNVGKAGNRNRNLPTKPEKRSALKSTGYGGKSGYCNNVRKKEYIYIKAANLTV
jgi:hypothetical protein